MDKYTLEQLVTHMDRRDNNQRIREEDVDISEYVIEKLNKNKDELDLTIPKSVVYLN